MAIAKMKKVTLVAPLRYKDSLLEAVQELQNLELIPGQVSDDQEILFSTNQAGQLLKEKETYFNQLLDGIQFLEKFQKKPSFIEKYRNPREEYSLRELAEKVNGFAIKDGLAKIASYKKKIRSLQDKARQLEEKEALLRQWYLLDQQPIPHTQQSLLHVMLGVIPQAVDNFYRKQLEDSSVLYVNEVYHTKDEVGVIVAFYKKEADQAQMDLSEAHFSEFFYPYERDPKQELAIVKMQQEERDKQETDLYQELRQEKNLLRQFQLASELAYNDLQREESKALLVDSERLFILQGWLNARDFTLVQNQLASEYSGINYAFFEEEIKEEEYEKVPIILENHKIIRPFESLIEMFGMPKYGELDPTPYTAPFYLVFFGMMVADLGYGLLLWGVTFAALKLLHLDKGLQKSLWMFNYLAIPTMIWGLVFGSFFGFDLPFKLLSLSSDLITLMIISLVFGVIQVMLGLALGAYKSYKQKAYAEAYMNSFGWFIIFVGVILYIVATMVYPIPLLAQMGKWIALVAAGAILLVAILTSSNKWGGLASGLYNLYGVSGYASDIISYTRLMALAVSGGSIASAFNMLVGFLPPIMRFSLGIILFLALQGLNIFLSYLGAYVHGMRLQFVEFFGKFYEGGGRPFKPFKTYEKYIYIENKLNNKTEEQ